MSVFEAWLRTPWAWGLGWAIVHSVWQGAMIAALLGVVLMATRSPRIRYAAACLAMLGMLASFIVTVWVVGLESPEAGRTVTAVDLPSLRAWPIVSAGTGFGVGFAVAVPYVSAVWIIGVGLFYAWCFAGWLSLRRLRRSGVCAVTGYWKEHLEVLGRTLGVSRPVKLMESMLTEVPVVLGHLRPMILMPAGLLAGLPVEQIEAILLHELAHVRRCDYLLNLVQRSVEGFFFYHPAAWWISHVIRREREHCCDDAAVAISGNRYEYVRALAELEQNRRPSREPAVAATGGNLMNRIRRLLAPKPAKGFHAPVFAAVLLVVTVVALAAYQGETAKPGSPYTKWLNEDVVYLIAPEERVAFEKLATEAERVRFIEQFWLRRDTTPGTPANEAKEEHYRRIAYANQRFAAPNRAGWATDRGRIYIQWGPPDEIESHPSGRAGSPPFETWRYHQIERIGKNLFITFIDFSRKGDYQVAPAPPVRL
jgi:GWxTD domain-containing protein